MLHNLLTTDKRKHARREYMARLATVAAFGVSVSFGVGMLALLPSYAYLQGELLSSGDQVTASSTDAEEGGETRALLRKAAYELGLFRGTLSEDRPTALVSEALALRPEGVVVTGYSFEREAGRVTVGGVASNRNVLVTYSRNLEKNPRFTSVQLPISNYAKSNDLPFRISFTVETPHDAQAE